MWPFKKKDIEEPEIVGNRAVAATECERPIQARVSQYSEVDGKRKVTRMHCELCGAQLMDPAAGAA